MFDFSRNAARFFAAVAATVLLASCGGSSDDTPAPPPFGATTYVVGASLSDNGNRLQPVGGELSAVTALCAGCVLERHAMGDDGGRPLRRGRHAFATGWQQLRVRAARVPARFQASRPRRVFRTWCSSSNRCLSRSGFIVIPQNLVIVDGSTFGNNINDALEPGAGQSGECDSHCHRHDHAGRHRHRRNIQSTVCGRRAQHPVRQRAGHRQDAAAAGDRQRHARSRPRRPCPRSTTAPSRNRSRTCGRVAGPRDLHA